MATKKSRKEEVQNETETKVVDTTGCIAKDEIVNEEKLTKSITVYEALSERKILKDRIGKLVNGNLECTFVYDPKTNGIHRGAKIDRDELDKVSISRIDKVAGLIERYSLLSELIDHSNATTPITIGNKQYKSKSAAMAVYGVIDHEIAIYEGIKARITANVRIVSDNSLKMLSEDKIAEYIGKLNLPIESTSDTYTNIRETYIKQNTLELVDPKNMRVKVDEILEELMEFRDRFNTEINKSNLQTFIEVPLD